MENDLSLVPYEELLKELNNRFEHWIFSGAKNLNDGKSLTVRRWGGNGSVCAGLAQMVGVAVYDATIEDNEDKGDVEI